PLRERVVEVDLARLERPIHELIRELLGDRPHAGHLARRERAREQSAQPVVIGRVEEHHRAAHPVDVGAVAPALLLVVAHADRAEAPVEQRLHHVGIAQKEHGAELGYARRARSLAQERRGGPVRIAEEALVEVELGQRGGIGHRRACSRSTSAAQRIAATMRGTPRYGIRWMNSSATSSGAWPSESAPRTWSLSSSAL